MCCSVQRGVHVCMRACVNRASMRRRLSFRQTIRVCVNRARTCASLTYPDCLSVRMVSCLLLCNTQTLKPDEYNSGTFFISNLGMYGVSDFGALLPVGAGSILAIGGALPTV